MSDARIHRPKNRLAPLVLGRGGITAGEAVHRAETAVGRNKHNLVEAIDALLATLEARYGAASPSTGAGDSEGLYELASRIIDIAFCLGGTDIEEAARATCHLADVSQELGVWDQQAVEIHLEVLRLLRKEGARMSPTRRRHLIEDLYRVTAKRIGEAPGHC